MLIKKIKIFQLFPCSTYRFCSILSTCPSDVETHEILDKDSQLSDSCESPYYVEDGLRKVYPYYFLHQTYCKNRWIGRTVLDVYCNEFGLYPVEEYIKRINQGTLNVNGKIVDLNYSLKNADLLSSLIHRHELPVLACPIKIISEDEDFLVVDKPPSIPVHPTGMYFQNSLIRILANEYGYLKLFVNYRLDRLTSGVLVLSKSREKAQEVHRQINLRCVQKEYVCRVEGNFPDTTVICTKPIKKFYNTVGISLVHHKGKICVTEFKKLSFNGKSSVVSCKPITGRTHQIRVHLQFLGFPVLNDPLYNSNIFGPEKGKNGKLGKPINQLLQDLSEEHCSEWGYNQNNKHNKNELFNSVFKEYYKINDTSLKYEKKESRFKFDDSCYFCKLSSKDPVHSRLGLYLHALKYEGEGWKFESEMPFWASENWTKD